MNKTQRQNNFQFYGLRDLRKAVKFGAHSNLTTANTAKPNAKDYPSAERPGSQAALRRLRQRAKL